MDRLYEKLCRILEEMDQKDKLSASDVQIIDWVTHAKKSMLCIKEMEDNYSEDDGMSSMSSRSYRSSREGGSSRASRASRARSGRRDSRGRYSGEESYTYSREGRNEMIDRLEELLEEAPDEQSRQTILKLIREMESV